jgi:hypothetical protein
MQRAQWRALRWPNAISRVWTLCALVALVALPQIWGNGGGSEGLAGETAAPGALVRAGWLDDLWDAIRDLMDGNDPDAVETPGDGGAW